MLQKEELKSKIGYFERRTLQLVATSGHKPGYLTSYAIVLSQKMILLATVAVVRFRESLHIDHSKRLNFFWAFTLLFDIRPF